MSERIPFAILLHKYILLAILLFLCDLYASGIPTFNAIGIDMRDGLPESRVRRFCELPDGRVAVLTAGYLSLFDGTCFRNFPLDLNKSIPLVDYEGGVGLYSDGANLIWIKKGAHLLGFDLSSEEFVDDPGSLLGKGLPSGDVSNFFIDDNRRYWVTMPAGELYMKKNKDYVPIFKLQRGKKVLERVAANDTLVLLCYKHGYIDVVDITSGELLYGGSAFSPVQSDSLRKDISVELVGDNLFIGHDYENKHINRGVLSRFNLKNLRWTTPIYIPFHLLDVKYSKTDSNMYMIGNGIAVIKNWMDNPVTLDMFDYDEDSDKNKNSLTSLLFDKNGGMWIGTVENGIFYHHNTRLSCFNNLKGDFIYGKQPEYNNLLAKEIAETVAPGITNCAVTDENLRTYIATRHGLLIVNPDRSVAARIDGRYGCGLSNVQSMEFDQQGDLWFASPIGISMVSPCDDGSFDIYNYGKLDGIELDGKEFRLREMAIDTLGIIHVGYAGGSYSFSPMELKSRSYGLKYNTKSSKNENQFSPTHEMALYVRWLILMVCVAGIFIIELVHRRKRVKSFDKRGNKLEAMLNARNNKIETADEQFLNRLSFIVDENIKNEELTVQKLSELMAMDRTVIYRKMQTLTGVSPSVYIKNRRMKIASRLLSEGKYPVATVATMVGFSNARYFSKVFKETFGVAPTCYQGEDVKML